MWGTAALASLAILFAFAMVEPPLTHRLSAREITRGAARDVAGIPGLLRLIVYSISVFVLLRIGITLYYNPVLTEAGSDSQLGDDPRLGESRRVESPPGAPTG